jgi:hypothetical protein
MQKISLIAFIILFRFISCISQDSIFILHPAVGEIIDKNEKKQFYLFPEINDSNFKFCYIKTLKEGYLLYCVFISDSVITNLIDTIKIQEYNTNINKLVEFYAYEAKKDSLNNSKENIDLKTINNNNPNKDLISNDVRSKIDDETRANTRMKEDNERLNLKKQGADITGDGVRVEWHRKKKK